MTKRTEFTATAPNGATYTFRASTKPAAVRFLDITGTRDAGAPNVGDRTYIISTHRSVAAAGTSFQTPVWKQFLRPDSVCTEIREAGQAAGQGPCCTSCSTPLPAEAAGGDGRCGMCG
jgi:hypothetical protein